MAMPNYEQAMLPFLKAIVDGNEYAIRDVVTKVADHFQLTTDERAERTPSGQQLLINNRVG